MATDVHLYTYIATHIYFDLSIYRLQFAIYNTVLMPTHIGNQQHIWRILYNLSWLCVLHAMMAADPASWQASRKRGRKGKYHHPIRLQRHPPPTATTLPDKALDPLLNHPFLASPVQSCAPLRTVPHHATQYPAVQYRTVPHKSVLHNPTPSGPVESGRPIPIQSVAAPYSRSSPMPAGAVHCRTVESSQPCPIHSGPIKAECSQIQSTQVRSSPAHTSPAGPIQPGAAQPSPVQSTPANLSNPVQRCPIQSSPLHGTTIQ